ncbi:hypothetical protein AADZ91_15950 [Colwelliaceae bacterium 6441]
MSLHNSNTYPIENWLNILIFTYREFPSSGLAKVINYYIERVIIEEDYQLEPSKLCHYYTMKKFWAWRSNQ